MSERKREASAEEYIKKKKKVNVPFTILAVVFLIITIYFVVSVIKLNLLPGSFIGIFCVFEVLLTGLILFGLIPKRRKIIANVITLIFAIIISLGYIFGARYINATNNFIKDTFAEETEKQEYYVVVKKDSENEKIEDLFHKKIYSFNIEEDVQNEIKEKSNCILKEEDSLSLLGKNLLKGKQEAILISFAQYDMLDDEIKDFKENTKIIYTAIREVVPESKELKDSKHTIENGIFNVYISGIDNSGSIRNTGRSDANILATVNTKTHKVLLTSIPRDYYVTLHSKKAKDKLTHSGIYGVNETITTVEDVLDVDINYYVRVNFSTVIKLVDALGGVNVHSDYNFNAGGYSFTKGNNYMNGKKALAFSRERHSFNSGDNQRIKNQQYVIEGIMKKAMSPAILSKYTTILNSLKGCFQTNIESSEISTLVKSQLDNMSAWDISECSLTGSGSHLSTYSAGAQKLYVMIPNQESVSSAKEKIDLTMKGNL